MLTVVVDTSVMRPTSDPRTIEAERPSFDPREADAAARRLNKRGLALIDGDRLEEATRVLQRAVGLDPGFAEAWNNYGVALQRTGRHEEAVEAHSRALALDPRFVEAHNNLGAVLAALDSPGAAFDAFDRALAIDPADPTALENRAAILRALNGRLARGDAEGTTRQIARLAVRHFDAEQYEAAFPYLTALLVLKPADADARKLHLATLLKLNRLEEAAIALEQMIAWNPADAEALNVLVGLHDRLGNVENAASAFRRLLAIRSDVPKATALRFQYALQLGEWSALPALVADALASVEAEEGWVAPFGVLSVSTSPAQQLKCARAFVRRQFGAIEPLPRRRMPPLGGRKLRIGYLSADFRNHAVALLMADMLEAHDRDRFAIEAFCWSRDDGSELQQRVRAAFDRHHDIRGRGDRTSAELVRRSQIDILVDLMGMTREMRQGILAYRPAPIQINFLGYPGTIGAPWIDYIVGDPIVIPHGAEPFYEEQVIRLPHCYQPNDRNRPIAHETPPRAECGLPAERVVFCNLTQFYKINPSIYDLWMRILRDVPDSVLWLLEPKAASARATLCREAQARGVDPARLVFAPKVANPQHLARQRNADLILDTFPYVSHTTATESLWVDTPILTLTGETFASRVCASILRQLGLDDLIAAGADDYVAKASALARDPAARTALRRRIAVGREDNILFDGARFVRSLERVFTLVAERAAAGLPPQGFDL
jgi:predicted O-linked N-acetylglucosamine transferase (SPINDLY family)